MTPGTTAPVVGDERAASPVVKTRDAGNTQSLLLLAARRRFARDGYAATTVREIAADAGVNVALINRYFTSKEGLFEACLVRAVAGFERRELATESVESVVRDIVRQVGGSLSGEHSLQLLLLLRSSGDDGAERIRRDIFRRFGERVATVAGWKPDDPSTAHLLLRAQVAISTAFGMVLLRSTSGLEPLGSATEEELAAPLGEVLVSLLTP